VAPLTYYNVVGDEPLPGSLTVIVEQPPQPVPDSKIWIEYEAGSRTRVLIEGRSDLVRRLSGAMAAELRRIQEELKAANPC
jgi:hypothetical protein